MEIEVKRTSLAWLGVITALALLGLAGYVVSPRDAAGRPRLYLQDVRAVETYRASAADWAGAWRILDTTLGGVLASSQTDLLQQSRQAQGAFDRAVDLASQVDGQDAPPTLVGLREQALAAATRYTDAAIAVNRWLSAPSPDNLSAAQVRLAEARAALASLEANQWLIQPGAATATPLP